MLKDEEIDELLHNELLTQLELFELLNDYGRNNMFNRSVEDSSLPADKKYPPLMMVTNPKHNKATLQAWMRRNRADLTISELRDKLLESTHAYGLLVNNVAKRFYLADLIINNW